MTPQCCRCAFKTLCDGVMLSAVHFNAWRAATCAPMHQHARPCTNRSRPVCCVLRAPGMHQHAAYRAPPACTHTPVPAHPPCRPCLHATWSALSCWRRRRPSLPSCTRSGGWAFSPWKGRVGWIGWGSCMAPARAAHKAWLVVPLGKGQGRRVMGVRCCCVHAPVSFWFLRHAWARQSLPSCAASCSHHNYG